MSENYLMLNGKRIDLTEEQVKTLTAEEKKSPFERMKKGDKYFFIEYDGEVDEDTEAEVSDDDSCYSIANYCTDKAMMEQRALHETLNRILWRYSEERGGDNEWNGCKYHWRIVKNEETKTFSTEYNSIIKEQGIIYFKNKETAQSAIEEIIKPFMKEHPKFVW